MREERRIPGQGRTVVVVPCFNERARLDVERFRDFVEREPDTEVLFVDDGSTDGTGALLRDVTAASEGLFLLSLPENRGKAEAVRQGILHGLDAGADFIGYWDADLSTPLDEVPRLTAHLQANPALLAVIGSRVMLLGRRIERNPWRHYVGRVFATGASLALGLPVYDTQCGAKLFRATDAVRSAFSTPFSDRWVFDVELIGRITDAAGGAPGDVVHEWPLTEWRDVEGSKVGLADGLRAWWAIVRLWIRRRSR